MSKLAERTLYLVDGYAGPNEYKGKLAGSTVVMCEVAKSLSSSRVKLEVIACENDAAYFDTLSSGLNEYTSSGILHAFRGKHEDLLPTILAMVGNEPALVFLDPQGPADLPWVTGMEPWLRRKKTDVLGLFHAGSTARICSAATVLEGPGMALAAERILGGSWEGVASEADASERFLKLLRLYKRFAGLYPLRKAVNKVRAYAVFGASDSAHGFMLLSDAVARDLGRLRDADEKALIKRTQQFVLLGKEEAVQQSFDELVALSRPFLQREPGLNGKRLSLAMHADAHVGPLVFGKYKERDFTSAVSVYRLRGR